MTIVAGIRLSATALLVGALCACATPSGPTLTTPEAPKPGTATVFFFRQPALPGSGIQHEIAVNAAVRGKLLNGSYMRLDLAVPAALDIPVVGCAQDWALPFFTGGEVVFVEVALVPRTINAGGRYLFDYGCRTRLVSRGEIPPAIVGLRSIN